MIKQHNATFKNLKQPLSNVDEQKYPIYKPLKKIGQGNFGKAYLVESDHDHKLYILKKIRIDTQSKQAKQAIFQEVKLMQNLNHLYIIKYIQSFVQDKSVCLVMQYAQNGDLQKYLERRKKQNNPLSQEQVISWFVQICLGLKYIHQRKVLHRDLKTDNIFITADNQLKIGDFGISKIMNETYDLAKTKIGTPYIMAPQIFEDMKYNQKCDIWSLGCILYKLQMLKYPFQSSNILAMVSKMNKEIEPIKGVYSEELKKLTYQLLSFQPQQRPSVHKILQIQFIKKHLPQVLENSISIHNKTQSSFAGSSKNLQDSNGTPILHKISARKSISSLSNSILTPLSQKNRSLTSVINNNSTSKSYFPLNQNNYKKSENLKMIEFKQNYPILVQENKQIKEENQKLKNEKQLFEKTTEQLIEKISDNLKKYTKEDILDQFKSHILNYVYN